MKATQEVIQQNQTSLYVMFCWCFAACGGLTFGYDIGISGGVTSMDDFLIKFFPRVYQRKIYAIENNYCKFNDQMLQLFTSSLYLAAIIDSFGASKCCSKFGRKLTILAASIFFLIGAGVSAEAQFTWMLILGRIFLGIGVGFGNESVPLFLSEVAPVERRGPVNILFQLFITIGIFIANLVNYGTSFLHPNGWRVSLGIAALPALFLFIGSFIIPETPTSLIQRGQESAGKETLRKIRGVEDVTEEYMEIKAACERAERAKGPFYEMMKKPSTWPPLIIAIMYLQLLLALSMSFLLCSLSNAVDKFGRKILLLLACLIMFISLGPGAYLELMVVGGLLQGYLHDANSLTAAMGMVVVVFVCLFVFAFAWSWGPIGWLIRNETFPLEIRTEGYAFAVSANMICTFIIAQAFLSMLCSMRAFIFFFFAVWVVVMAIFVKFLVPETRNVPIDAMVERVWKRHPIWNGFLQDGQQTARVGSDVV